MGKRTKKIKKNIINTNDNCNKQSEPQEDLVVLEQINSKIAEYRENGQYEDALTTIIDAFEKGYVNKKLVSDTAVIYYALGDYERAIIWSKKALTFDKNNIELELLLAKVYALKDEMNNCFSTIEKLIENHHQISAELCSEIEDLLNYFADDYEKDDLVNNYPFIFDFIDSDEFVMEDMQEEKIVTEHIEDYCKVSDEPVVNADEAVIDDYACLKNKSIEEVIAAVMQQSVSLVEKVNLCLHFSVYYYMQKELVKTLMLLKQALLIDGKNELALKNTGFILMEMGEYAGALEVLSGITEKDLMVLKQIEKLSKRI